MSNAYDTDTEAEPLEDETIRCRDCGADFLFTASEQGFYFRHGLLNKPVRCERCRTARKAALAARGLGGR
jgi:hypothetical protein